MTVPALAPPADTANAPATVYLIFFGGADFNAIDSLTRTAANLATRAVETVHLIMMTPGGPVIPAVGAYNLLRAMPFKLITYNLGEIASAGTLLYLAGDERLAAPGSTFMMHPVSSGIAPNERLEERQLSDRASSVRADQERARAIYLERTRMSAEAFAETESRAVISTAEQAVENGFAPGVAPLAIPAGSAVYYINPPPVRG